MSKRPRIVDLTKDEGNAASAESQTGGGRGLEIDLTTSQPQSAHCSPRLPEDLESHIQDGPEEELYGKFWREAKEKQKFSWCLELLFVVHASLLVLRFENGRGNVLRRVDWDKFHEDKNLDAPETGGALAIFSTRGPVFDLNDAQQYNVSDRSAGGGWGACRNDLDEDALEFLKECERNAWARDFGDDRMKITQSVNWQVPTDVQATKLHVDNAQMIVNALEDVPVIERVVISGVTICRDTEAFVCTDGGTVYKVPRDKDALASFMHCRCK